MDADGVARVQITEDGGRVVVLVISSTMSSPA